MNIRRGIHRAIWGLVSSVVFGLCLCFLTTPAHAQATISTGSIQGTITDKTGAVIPGAKITITNKATGLKRVFQTTTTGAYSSGPLIPGDYVVSASAHGFMTADIPITVQVGVTSRGNLTLQVGQASTVVHVSGTAVAVNTQTATVQNVLTRADIKNLPINGQNFLSLAQLTPGVQMQDGANFDPTKNGFTSISIAGQYGRTAKIEVDGVSVSDETVGTTTENIPQGSIQEFSIEQSTLNPSSGLTSSGAVNIVTRSGTNNFHGDAWGLFRDSNMDAALPGPPGVPSHFSRSMFGGDLGGPILHNKLFFFADAQRTVQAQTVAVPVPAPFTSYGGSFSSPYRESDLLGRLDYSAPHNIHLFYQFSYFKNKAVPGTNFQPFSNITQTRQHILGADFATGNFTHSFRFSYLKFQNNIFDAVLGSQLPFANFPVSMNFDNGFATGPNLLAPQETPQSNHQFKYDGSWIHGNHILQYGIDFNHIQGGGFADFFGITPNVFPSVGSSSQQAAIANCPSMAPSQAIGDPLCYPMSFVTVGNNQGFSTEKPAFGFPAGGLGPDNRMGIYLGDTWRMRPNLTVNAAVRWDRDTGRTDSGLNTLLPVNNYLPGMGNRVQQANTNLAPQLGIAWDPGGKGKTAIRIGGGLFYENVIWNNVLFDRPLRLKSGSFLQFPTICAGPTAFPVPFGSSGPYAGKSPTIDQVEGVSGICGESIGAAAKYVSDFSKLYQQSWAVPSNLPNPSYVPTLLSEGVNVPLGLFAPGYKTPVSFQFNAGVQRQLVPGLVLSVNYLRTVNTHALLGIDANHSGDVAYFNQTAAEQAIAATNQSFGCAPDDVACAIKAGATMDNYAANGLTDPADAGGACQAVLGVSWSCAFPGINPSIGQVPFLFPVERSVYDAMMIKLTGNKSDVTPWLHLLNFTFGYTLSKFTNNGATDQAFVNSALNNNNPLAFSGWSSLDRTDMFSFGGYAVVPAHFKLGFIGHFFSPLPTTMLLPFNGDGISQMFQTDFTGTGVDASTSGAILPGTISGQFGRSTSPGQLNGLLTTYNTAARNAGCPAGMLGAGCPTPAGDVLIKNGLFTLSQLQELGAVAPSVPFAPAGQNGQGWLRDVDLSLTWDYAIAERVTVEPSVSFYNAFNFANFDLPGSELSGSLTGAACSVNGTVHGSNPALDCPTDRVGLGSGVFSQGAPRTLEFGLKISF